jgi:hypothetical protein
VEKVYRLKYAEARIIRNMPLDHREIWRVTEDYNAAKSRFKDKKPEIGLRKGEIYRQWVNSSLKCRLKNRGLWSGSETRTGIESPKKEKETEESEDDEDSVLGVLEKDKLQDRQDGEIQDGKRSDAEGESDDFTFSDFSRNAFNNLLFDFQMESKDEVMEEIFKSVAYENFSADDLSEFFLVFDPNIIDMMEYKRDMYDSTREAKDSELSFLDLTFWDNVIDELNASGDTQQLCSCLETGHMPERYEKVPIFKALREILEWIQDPVLEIAQDRTEDQEVDRERELLEELEFFDS